MIMDINERTEIDAKVMKMIKTLFAVVAAVLMLAALVNEFGFGFFLNPMISDEQLFNLVWHNMCLVSLSGTMFMTLAINALFALFNTK